MLIFTYSFAAVHTTSNPIYRKFYLREEKTLEILNERENETPTNCEYKILFSNSREKETYPICNRGKGKTKTQNFKIMTKLHFSIERGQF